MRNRRRLLVGADAVPDNTHLVLRRANPAAAGQPPRRCQYRPELSVAQRRWRYPRQAVTEIAVAEPAGSTVRTISALSVDPLLTSRVVQ